MTCSEFDRLLDLYLDGELDEAQRSAAEAHAAQCSECADKLKAAVALQGILSHMDDDVSVPLQAQATWRKAVREEAKRRKMKRIYTFAGAVAAVCVLTFGAVSMMQKKPADLSNVQRVETDGVSRTAAFDGETASRSVGSAQPSAQYIERVLTVDDITEALGYLQDVAKEYGAEIEREAESTQGMNVFVQVPAESAEEFISAVNAISTESDDSAYELDQSAMTVGVCVVMIGN